MRLFNYATLLCVLGSAAVAHAGVSIVGTRIIYPSNAKSVNVQLNNSLNKAALVQAWIDDGDSSSVPAAEKIPFILNPALTRVEAQKGQVIRILPLDLSHLAKDRESIFWFNMLDIPPEDPSLAQTNRINFTVRTRIKMFYRPSEIKLKPEQAYQGLQFQQNAQQQLSVNNPTPYYITLIKISDGTHQAMEDGEQAMMLQPFEQRTVNNFKLNAQAKSIAYSVINDLGASQNFEYKLNTGQSKP